MSVESDTRIPPLAGIKILSRSGLLDFTKPGRIVRLKRLSDEWGPMPAAIKLAVSHKPDALALVDDEGELTYRELDERTDAIAAAWLARGVNDASVIGVLGRNNRATIQAVLSAAKLGAKVLMLNTGFAAPQLAKVVSREGVGIVVHDAEFEDVVSGLTGVDLYVGLTTAASKVRRVTLEDLAREGVGATPSAPAHPGTIVLLTAGTTGLPKGAPRQVKSTDGIIQLLDRIPLKVNEATYVAVPLFHAIGLFHMMVALSFGSTVVLSNRFDARRALEIIERYRCTVVIAVPTMLRRIVDLGADEVAKHDLSALRVFFCGGSLLTRGLVEDAQRILGDVIYNMYGSTEVSVCTVATPADLRVAPGSAGKAPIGCVVRLLDDQDRLIEGAGITGRIFVATKLKFGGYTDGATKKMVDGMMSTGDVGHFDEHGNLFVDGRDDDMIVSGGENVYPGEVEELLISHTDIVEVYVHGVPDEEFGRRLAAHVVLKPGAGLTADEVRLFVRSNLARHKVPRDVNFLDELPRNAMGKVMRLAFEPER